MKILKQCIPFLLAATMLTPVYAQNEFTITKKTGYTLINITADKDVVEIQSPNLSTVTSNTVGYAAREAGEYVFTLTYADGHTKDFSVLLTASDFLQEGETPDDTKVTEVINPEEVDPEMSLAVRVVRHTVKLGDKTINRTDGIYSPDDLTTPNEVFGCEMVIEDTLTLDNELISENGRTYIAIRTLSELLEIPTENIKYDNKTKYATIKDGSNTLILRLNQNYATLNGKVINIDGQLLVHNNRIYLPISQIKDVFKDRNLTVDWNNTTKELTITHQADYDDETFKTAIVSKFQDFIMNAELPVH